MPVLATLWVPSYNSNSPTLGGISFFYWYQIMWVVLTALLMAVAYRLAKHDESRRRELRRRAEGTEQGGTR